MKKATALLSGTLSVKYECMMSVAQMAVTLALPVQTDKKNHITFVL